MNVKDLIKGLNYVKTKGNVDIEIDEITCNSKEAHKNSLFICIKGNNYDGHTFLKEIENNGCRCIISETELDSAITQIIVKDSRIAMASVSSIFYNHPEKKLKLIGIVGTNGKTSVSHIIAKILNYGNIKCGIIGTLGSYYNGNYVETSLTTPDPINLYRILNDMVEDGIKVVAVEVSAHAVYYKKIYGINFDIGVFTNLTQDHLDFFKTMDEYGKVKKSFFDNNLCKYIVSNSDDELGREIGKKKNAVSYGIKNPADIFAMNVKYNGVGSTFILNLFDCVYNVELKMIGEINVYNVLASATACALSGMKTDDIYKAILNLSYVEGRLERVFSKNFDIYVDYAHTPDGLYKAITSLKPMAKGRLICVFGCGGNRDKSKREIMGRISGENADLTIITSDNPRYEEPMDIIFEIEKGVLSVTKNYVLIQDRKSAIEYAIEKAKDGDIILVAGKGSEKYQEILGVKSFYNDKETIGALTNKLQ